MIKLIARLLIVAVFTGVVSMTGAAAYTLASEEGRFTVEMPEQPEFKTIPGTTDSGVSITSYAWQIDQGAKAWFIVYSVYPPKSQMSYDGAVEGAVRQTQGTLKSRDSINVFGVPGQEIMIEAPDKINIIRQRLFIVENRLYQAIYVGPIGTERAPEVGAFVDTFRIRR